MVIAGDWNINKRDDKTKRMWTAWCAMAGVYDTYTHETGAPAPWAQMAAGGGETTKSSWPDHIVASGAMEQDGLVRAAGVDEITPAFGSDHAQIAATIDFSRIMMCVEHTRGRYTARENEY